MIMIMIHLSQQQLCFPLPQLPYWLGVFMGPLFVNETKGEVTLGLLRKLCFLFLFLFIYFFGKRTVLASSPGKLFPLPLTLIVMMIRALCSWKVVSSHHLEDVCLLRRECDQIQRGKQVRERGKRGKLKPYLIVRIPAWNQHTLGFQVMWAIHAFPFFFCLFEIVSMVCNQRPRSYFDGSSHTLSTCQPPASLSPSPVHAHLSLYTLLSKNWPKGMRKEETQGVTTYQDCFSSTVSSEHPRNSLAWETLGLRNGSQRKASCRGRIGWGEQGSVWSGSDLRDYALICS